MNQYTKLYGFPNADPFIITDVKSGKGGKLLVITEWLTTPIITLKSYIDPKTLKLSMLDGSQNFFWTQSKEEFISFSNNSKDPVADYAYVSISKKVYYISSQWYKKEVTGAHFPSFQTLPWFIGIVMYAKDKNHAYFQWNIISWADPLTYTLVGKSIEKDKNNVYIDSYRIAGADTDSIQELDLIYYKDKNYVYYYDSSKWLITVIKGADPKTFRVDDVNYNSGFAKDDYGVYKDGMKIGWPQNDVKWVI